MKLRELLERLEGYGPETEILVPSFDHSYRSLTVVDGIGKVVNRGGEWTDENDNLESDVKRAVDGICLE